MKDIALAALVLTAGVGLCLAVYAVFGPWVLFLFFLALVLT